MTAQPELDGRPSCDPERPGKSCEHREHGFSVRRSGSAVRLSRSRCAAIGLGRLSAVTRFVTAGAAFLVAVLWFDLMHDVQALGSGGRALSSTALDSIAGYYRRVTTDAFPMNRLVSAVMLSTLGLLIAQLAVGGAPRWMSATDLCLVTSAVALAAARTVPNAKRLGQQTDDASTQSSLARAVCTDHLSCLGALLVALTLELVFG